LLGCDEPNAGHLGGRDEEGIEGTLDQRERVELAEPLAVEQRFGLIQEQQIVVGRDLRRDVKPGTEPEPQ